MTKSPARRQVISPQRSNVDITLIFDGGSIGNPGKGYGSALISGISSEPILLSFEFDGRKTNNEAEYLTLIHSLRHILHDIEMDSRVASTVSIAALSDSMLVVEQLNGRWKVRNAGLRPLHSEAADLMSRFGFATIAWHPRQESVRILGH